jgi:hypothetical protein
MGSKNGEYLASVLSSSSLVHGGNGHSLATIATNPFALTGQIRKAVSARGLIETKHRDAVDLEIVVPALNEERRIGPTIKALVAYLEQRAYSSALVVVDNGCVDRTADVVAELEAASPIPIHLINCCRRGKGAAVRRGILTSQARYVGFCDADLATPVDTLDRVWPLLESGLPVVIGSRYCGGAARLSGHPRWLQLDGGLFRALAGRFMPEVTDTQCGFKFFQGPIVRELLSSCNVDGFAFDLELLIAARAAGLRVREIPVVWSDQAGSTVRPIPDGIRSLADALSLALRHYAMPSRPAKRRVAT